MAFPRLDKAQGLLSLHHLDLLLIEKPIDIFYLTGITVSLGRLAITAAGAHLFVDQRYLEEARKKNVCPVSMPEDLTSFIAPFRRVGFDSAFTSYDRYQFLAKTYPSHEWKPLSTPLKKLRMKKEPQEIKALTDAARITFQGYKHAESFLKEGVSEAEIAWEFELFCRKKGASALSFEPVIAFGENSAYPHHRAGPTRLKPNTIVLFDVGAIVHGYAGDLTRVHFFGKPDPQLQKDYDLTRRVQAEAIQALIPGTPFKEIDDLVRKRFAEHGCADLFTHGLSHGIGLEVHEPPSLRKVGGDYDLILEEGMVFTVEPGLYRPGLGGVRYEDVALVTKTGGKVLYEEF